MSNWQNFNDAEQQTTFKLVPVGTLVKTVLHIRPGGYDDPNNGWVGGFATHNANSGTVYLDCECTVIEGEYARCKLWLKIGLLSPKKETWANMGRSMVRAILESARGISPDDNSEEAQKKRSITDFSELNTLEFIARAGQEKSQQTGEIHNVVKAAVTPKHKDYAKLMSGQLSGQTPTASGTQQPQSSGGFNWAG